MSEETATEAAKDVDAADVRTYRRNPDLLLEWEPGGGAVAVDTRSARRFAARPALLGLLGALSRPMTAAELHAAWQPETYPEPGDLVPVLERLASVGLVLTRAPAPDGWTAYELAVHARSAHGPSPDARQGTPEPARLVHPDPLKTVPLEDAGADGRDERADGGHSFTEVLSLRRSGRGFAPGTPLPLPAVTALLHRAARVRGYLPPRAYEQTQRPSPSGGGRHSTEIYLLARDVAGLAPGAYHYDPFDHALHLLTPWDEGLSALHRRLVVEPAMLTGTPQLSLYLAARARRTTWKYEGMALSLIYRDTGCLLQTLCLTAADLGLAACPVGLMEAPPTAPFLAPYQEGSLHVGSLALGVPSVPGMVPGVVPGVV